MTNLVSLPICETMDNEGIKQAFQIEDHFIFENSKGFHFAEFLGDNKPFYTRSTLEEIIQDAKNEGFEV